MQLKNILKLSLLAAVPAVIAKDCNKENIDSPDCQADVLIVTTKNKQEDEGFKSVIGTLEKFSVPTNQYTIDESGTTDEEIRQVIYKDQAKKLGRYKAIVFPNGRISYNTADGTWASALSDDQWAIFEEYTASTNNRIVYLNEYPSNNTGTLLYNDQFRNFQVKQPIVVPEDSAIAEELNSNNLNTLDTWHFPAKIDPNYNLLAFESVEPLLYFQATQDVPELPEDTVAAVSCKKNDGSQFAAFFLSFGQWSKTSASLNVYWLTWALNTDISKISDKHLSTKEAIEKASDAQKSSKLIMAFLLSSLSAIVLALF
jgi:hypothetical protein